MALLGLRGKIGATIQSVLLFFIISNPMTYRLTDSLLGGVIGNLTTVSGGPTTLGLIVHSIVFGLITYQLMKL